MVYRNKKLETDPTAGIKPYHSGRSSTVARYCLESEYLSKVTYNIVERYDYTGKLVGTDKNHICICSSESADCTSSQEV